MQRSGFKSQAMVSLLLLGSLLILNACGGGSSSGGNPPPPPGQTTAPVSLTIGDAPPAGVTVLSFEVTVTQARLQPGNVNVLSAPLEIEVKGLEVEPAILSTMNVATGTYTSLDVTVANPELTFRVDALPAPNVACNRGTSVAVGDICEIELTTMATVSLTLNPQLTVATNSSAALFIDANLNNIIQSTLAIDLSAAGGLTVTQLQATQGVFEELEDVIGRITALRASSSEFDMQTSAGQTLTVRTDANTEFDDFDDPGGVNCAANNFSCLAVNQVVEVDLELRTGGVLVAEEVEALDNEINNEELDGTVVAVPGTSSTFEMVLIDESINAAALEIGNRVAVNLQAGARFRIDDDHLNVMSGDFDAVGDMMPGQVVEVQRVAGPTGTPPTIDADEIKLKDTRFTATVQSVDAVNNRFVLSGVPGILGVATLEIRVQPGDTEFENVSGLSGLAAGNTVSVRGLLFKGAGTPFLIAKKVRRR